MKLRLVTAVLLEASQQGQLNDEPLSREEGRRMMAGEHPLAGCGRGTIGATSQG